MNIANFIFFDENSVDLVSNDFVNPQAGTIMLQVEILDGTVDLDVEAMIDLNRPTTYFPIKAVNLEDLTMSTNITKEGIYMIPFEGIQKIRLISNEAVGGFRAFAVATR